MDNPNKTETGAILQIVRIKSELTEEELLEIAREREPRFAELPGLLQKYYVKFDQANEFGGIYVWDNVESLQKYRESDLAKTIAKAYKAIEAPSVEVMNILFKLRD